MMTQKDKWRELLLKTVLFVGGITLTIFPVVYALQDKWFFAVLEAISGLFMWISFILVNTRHIYRWPAIIGWLGVMLVLVVLLFTGGVNGTGLLWWTLLPIISFILFGSKNGLKTLASGYIIFFLTVLLRHLRIVEIYFSMTEMIMCFSTVTIISVLMYNYENIAGKTRDEAQLKADLLAEQAVLKKAIEDELIENITKLKDEKKQTTKYPHSHVKSTGRQ